MGMLLFYEYKKILKRKSIYFALVLVIFVCTFAMVGDVLLGQADLNGELVGSKLSVVYGDREAIHGAAGLVTPEKIEEVIANNAIARESTSKGGRYPEDVYEKNIRPYSGLRASLIRALSPNYSYEVFDALNPGDPVDFYGSRDQRLREALLNRRVGEAELTATEKVNEEIKNPFYFDFADGYQKFLLNMSTSSVFLFVAVAICVAPVFASEYSQKTDALLLTSRHGKGKLIWAKVCASLSFSLILCIFGLGLALGTIFFVYGTLGGNVSIQLLNLLSVYPLTMAQAVLTFCGVILAAALVCAALTLLFSALFRSAFPVMIGMTALLFGGMFLSLPFENPVTDFLMRILPTKMGQSHYVFSDRLVNVFGAYVKPYVVLPCFCLLAVLTVLPFIFRAFRNHKA